jgi:hypothetical protein
MSGTAEGCPKQQLSLKLSLSLPLLLPLTRTPPELLPVSHGCESTSVADPEYLALPVTVHVFVTLGKYFVSVKYVFVCIKLMCVYVKLLKI